MDWPRQNGEFLPDDRGLFEFEDGESTILRKLETDKVCEEWPLTSENDWMDWFLKHQSSGSAKQAPGVELILAGRARDEADDAKSIVNNSYTSHNTHLIMHLPFVRTVFDEVIDMFFVHGSVARALQRGYAFFSRTPISVATGASRSQPAISYICRASHQWSGDMALSITFFPETGFSYGIFYGCDSHTKTQITGRIANSGDAVGHPLLSIGIFAEIERRRHIRIVKLGIERLLDTVEALSKKGSDYKAVSPEDDETEHAIHPWLNVHHLKNGLESWKTQLQKMIEHADELSQNQFAAKGVPSVGQVVKGKVVTINDVYLLTEEEKRKERLRRTGARIQERLKEIMHDYEEKIRECMIIMEGMTLATQLAHTKANMEIAISTSRDSNQMKSIATLTMVFLPGTFLATLFSMSFFKWDANEAEGESRVSSLVWIYFVITIVLTAITLMLYSWWSNRHDRKLSDQKPIPGP